MKGALGGVGVTLLAIYGVRAANLAITFVAAATLGPGGMGLLAAALISVEFIDVVRDLGVREALVYRPVLNDSMRRAASFLSVSTALAQASALGLIALISGQAGKDPLATAVFAALSPLFLFSAVGSVPDALLQRAGRFGARAAAEIAGVAVKLGAALWLLALGEGVWAMVIAILASSATRSAVLVGFAGWNLPDALPKRNDLRWLARYGRHIVSSNVAYFLRLKSDQLSIATFVGDAALGVYFMAARLPELFIMSVNMAISTVAFPHYARLGDDIRGLRLAYLDTVGASMLVMAPVSVGAAVLGEQALMLVLGEEWRETGVVMGFLMLSGVPLTLGWSCGDVLKARGDTRGMAWLNWMEATVAVTLTAGVAAVTHDLLHVAVAMLASSMVGACLRLRIVARAIGVTGAETVALTMPAMMAAAGMGGVVWWMREATASMPELGTIALCIGTGVAVYAALIGIVDRVHVGRLIRLARTVRE